MNETQTMDQMQNEEFKKWGFTADSTREVYQAILNQRTYVEVVEVGAVGDVTCDFGRVEDCRAEKTEDIYGFIVLHQETDDFIGNLCDFHYERLTGAPKVALYDTLAGAMAEVGRIVAAKVTE